MNIEKQNRLIFITIVLVVFLMFCFAYVGYQEVPVGTVTDLLKHNSFGRFSFFEMLGGTVLVSIVLFLIINGVINKIGTPSNDSEVTKLPKE